MNLLGIEETMTKLVEAHQKDIDNKKIIPNLQVVKYICKAIALLSKEIREIKENLNE